MSLTKKNNILLQAVLIFYWFILLLYTDSYYGVYLIVGICSLCCFYMNVKEKGGAVSIKKKGFLCGCSCLFSIFVTFANYAMFLNLPCPDIAGLLFRVLYKGFSMIGVFIGGVVVFWNILFYLTNKLSDFYWAKQECSHTPSWVYGVSWLLLSIINISILLLCKYPGNLTPDSFTSIRQSLRGQYSNHHPFYYTMVIKFFLELGRGKDINFSVALYSIFQIIFMAACFSFVIVTLYQMNISLKLIWGCWIWYAIMPFYILFSFTMWKDVMFGGFILVFIISLFRVLNDIGRYRITNYSTLIVGSIGTCLFRSNGWFVFVLTFLCFVLMYWKTKKKLCGIFVFVIIFTYILENPVLDALGVTPTGIVDYLSVPAQQIARVITDCDDIDREHIEMLSKIIDVEAIPDAYKPTLSDPLKDLIKQSGQEEYLAEHKSEYFKLYLAIGITHPVKYVEAWIDLTRGYWNGGYEALGWDGRVRANDFGVERIVYSSLAEKILEEYCFLYVYGSFRIFSCIGVYTWLVIGLGIMNAIRKSKEGGILVISNLFVLLSVIISTPQYCTLRYMYAIFCCFPFLLFATFYRKNVDNTISIK